MEISHSFRSAYCVIAGILLIQIWIVSPQQLYNCMYGYSSAIKEGRSIIYSVYKDGILTYAVEIVGNKIIQALGKYNAKIDKEDRDIIDMWFKEVYIKSWMGALE